MDPLSRRRGREIALQVLYQSDTQDGPVAEEALRLHASHFGRPTADEPAPDDELPLSDKDHLDAREYAARIVRGFFADRDEVDALVQRASRNWRLDRMARVDRNLLRLGAWELMRAEDVPAKAAINEAIEIAKRFGTAESPAFINGILDRCLDEIGRRDEGPRSDGARGEKKPTGR